MLPTLANSDVIISTQKTSKPAVKKEINDVQIMTITFKNVCQKH